MRNRSLEVTVQTYLARVEALEQEYKPVAQCNFIDITRNLLQEMYIPEVHDRAKASLDSYLALVETFPDFRKAETSSEAGLFTAFSGSPSDYVSYAVQQLRR